MTECVDCPSTSTPPPSCPEPPDGSNCCLRIRYLCVDGIWTLDVDYTECLDNTECSAFSQTCTDTEFSYEMQNGCICFDLPDPLCDPVEAGCECTSTTTTSTTTSSTTTTSTTTTSTTTTTPPPELCPAGSIGSWDFDTSDLSCHPDTSPMFEARPAGADAGCCYKIVFTIEGVLVADGSCPLGPIPYRATIGDVTGLGAGIFANTCGGVPDTTIFTQVGLGGFSTTVTRYICSGDTFQLIAVQSSIVFPAGILSGTVSWVITVEDETSCAP